MPMLAASSASSVGGRGERARMSSTAYARGASLEHLNRCTWKSF